MQDKKREKIGKERRKVVKLKSAEGRKRADEKNLLYTSSLGWWNKKTPVKVSPPHILFTLASSWQASAVRQCWQKFSIVNYQRTTLTATWWGRLKTWKLKRKSLKSFALPGNGTSHCWPVAAERTPERSSWAGQSWQKVTGVAAVVAVVAAVSTADFWTLCTTVEGEGWPESAS